VIVFPSVANQVSKAVCDVWQNSSGIGKIPCLSIGLIRCPRVWLNNELIRAIVFVKEVFFQ